MESPTKILIDTNIIIGLEDDEVVEKAYAYLNRICGENGIQILIHKSSFQDLESDKDKERQLRSRSKFGKYPDIPRTPKSKEEKEELFGLIKSKNDDIDTDLLVSLRYDMADILVTEDKDLKKRTKGLPQLENKVLNVLDTLELLKSHFVPISVEYTNVKDRSCEQYPHDLPFFDSLKEDYVDFDGWYQGIMREQRKCWVIESGTKLSGIIIYKEEESVEELKALEIPGAKVLKICLFKVDLNVRGEKYGEQLLKTAMDYAYRNKYDSTFLTVLPKQEALIGQIEKFGFMRGADKGSELSYYKMTKVDQEDISLAPFEFHQKYWPCVKGTGVEIYLVPIQPQFHARLFPESDRAISPPPPQYDLELEEPVSQTPGNAIRKIYVCNSQTKTIPKGSILLFYRSTDSLLTSIGVSEDYIEVHNSADLLRIAKKRSVYSFDELVDLTNKPVSAKALNFYYAHDLVEPITLVDLIKEGIIRAAPVSINNLPKNNFFKLYKKLFNNDDKEIFYAE